MAKRRPKIAILASCSGTTAEAVAEATLDGRLDADIALIVHDRPHAGVKNQPTIKRLTIPTICINATTHPGRARKGAMTNAESRAILDAVVEARCDLVILLGYLKQVRGALLKEFGYNKQDPKASRMLNSHPGPLPHTAGTYGRSTHELVYDLLKKGKLHATGPTLHIVSEEYDEGPVLQHIDEIYLTGDDTPDSIEQRVRSVERRTVPIGIQIYLDELAKVQ